jgi:MerR family redox-sensitive transcriptional activator SoxR
VAPASARVTHHLELDPVLVTELETPPWRVISRAFRKTLDERIATLQRLRSKLDECIGCGCLSLNKCQLYNPQDRVARHGAGPRLILGDPSEAR